MFTVWELARIPINKILRYCLIIIVVCDVFITSYRYYLEFEFPFFLRGCKRKASPGTNSFSDGFSLMEHRVEFVFWIISYPDRCGKSPYHLDIPQTETSQTRSLSFDQFGCC